MPPEVASSSSPSYLNRSTDEVQRMSGQQCRGVPLKPRDDAERDVTSATRGADCRQAPKEQERVQLDSVKQVKVVNGGYELKGYKWGGKAEQQRELRLHVGLSEWALAPGSVVPSEALARTVAITDLPSNNRLTEQMLEQVLGIYDEITPPVWSGTVLFTLLLVTPEARLIAASKSCKVDAPFKPYAFELAAELGIQPGLGEAAGIPYSGDDGVTGNVAPVLYHRRINGKYYFVVKNEFMTQNYPKQNGDLTRVKLSLRRGFNCTTFIGSVFHVDPNGKDGNVYVQPEMLARHLSNKSPPKEASTKTAWDEFWRADANRSGTFICHSSGHMCLIKDAVVHEFNSSKPCGVGDQCERGYFVTERAEDWPPAGRGGFKAQKIWRTERQL